MNRWVAAGVAAALLVGAWFVARVTPDGEELLADPFVVTATVGTPTEGRNLGVTVTGLTLADTVTIGKWQGDGMWLVVELDAWAVRTESPAALQSVEFVIGDRTYRASERPDATVTNATLSGAGLYLDHPRSGSVVFELPADVEDDRGTLRLSMFGDLPDSVIELPVDFGALDHVAALELPSVGWARS